MSNKKIHFLIILSLTLLLLITGCFDKKIDSINIESTQKMVSIIETSFSPAQIIKNEVLSGNNVIISETPGYIQNIQFLEYLIPILYDTGITEIGVWFLESSKQNELNTFLKGYGTGEEARKILASTPIANYDEYADVLLFVALFNKNLEPDEQLFSLIGLSEQGEISQQGLKRLKQNSEPENQAEETNEQGNTETPEIINPEQDISPKTIFIWSKKGNRLDINETNQGTSHFFLHSPLDQTLPKNKTTENETIIFEKALLQISPYDYVKAVSYESVKDIIEKTTWDWYILNGPASRFTTLKETNKEFSSQRKSDLKKIQKDIKNR